MKWHRAAGALRIQSQLSLTEMLSARVSPYHHLVQHTAQDMLKVLLLPKPANHSYQISCFSDCFIDPWILHSSFSVRFFCFSSMLPNLLSNNLTTLLITYTFVHFFLLYNEVFPLFCWDGMFSEDMWKVKQYFKKALIYYHWRAPPYLSLFQIFSVFYSYKKTQPTNCYPTHTELTPCRLFHYEAVSFTCYVRKILSKTQNPLYTLNKL